MPQPSRYITARITFRRATTKEWENNDPILLAGEPAIDTTANKFKIGDGISPWSSLDYVDGGAGGGGGTFWVNNGNFPEAVTNAAEAIDYLRFWQDSFEDNAAAYFNTGLEGGEFVPLHELNISAGTGGAASIVGEPADFNSYPEGTEVQIQALTFSNYEFSSWSGLLEGEENKALTTITMSGPRVLAAEFVVETPNQAPDVTLNGDAVITVYEGGEFTDPGAIYVDDKDGTGVAVASGVVDVDTLGQYTITYTYTDTGGLTSTPKIRIVNVVLPPDVDAPVITLNGDSSIQLDEGEPYVEQGATWTDNRDGSGSVTDITGAVGSAVGSYTITYNFTDAAGNSATPVTRTITVVDTTLPVITLNGSGSIQLSSGSSYTEEGATWTDNVDGSGSVTDITGTVDTGTLGTYTITYSYTDSAGNTATATRSITVVDTALPTITLNGSSSLEVDEDTTYTELGATWSDNIDGFGAVTDITTDLDITTPGTYTVRYNYTDTSGNKATEVVRTITVLEVDVTPASINVLGDNPTTLVVGQSYTDYGAAWFDDFDGSGIITGTGSVDVNTAGTYTITYSYTDDAGNEASATRTVNVVANDPIYVYSEANGGFYYPLYRYSYGLSAYHEHVLDGVTYYMQNSDTLGVENEDWAHGHHLYPSSTLGLDAGTPPPADSDNDGVPDAFDYWPTTLFMDNSLEELDTYIADPLRIIDVKDVVKILVTNEAGNAGDYVYVSTIYSSPVGYKFVRSDGTTYNGDDALASNRGTLWEVYTDPSLPRSADLSSFSEWNVADPSTTESSTATVKGLASGAEMTHVVYTLENGVFSFNGTDQSVTTGTFQSGETIQLIDPSNTQFEGFYVLSGLTTYTYNGDQQPKLTLATLQQPVITLNGDASIELNLGDTYTEAGATWFDNNDGTGAVTNISGGPMESNLTFELDDNISLDLIRVEPGTFTMGQSDISNASPEHEVTLTKAFYLGKYEVTQAQYEAVMTGNSNGLSATPSHFSGRPDNPVEFLSYNNIQVFLDRLNEQQENVLPSGWVYDLPTEAEWEYSCRAGTSTIYSWGDTISPTDANYSANGLGETTEVGLYLANAWGFYDMHGNVYEFTKDAWSSYTSSAKTDPQNQGTTSSERVIRGGEWASSVNSVRSAFRTKVPPSSIFWGVGFRLALKQSSYVSTGLDTSIPGNYTVTYNYTDSDGNAADPVVRTVVVLADTTAPVISITGSEVDYVDLNGTYTEQGATWTDNADGSGSVTDITGTVDTTTEGNYPLTYRHTDAAGNVGTKTRHVRVVQEDETTYFPGINESLGKWQITEQLVISEEESTLMTTTTARPEVGDVIRYTGANAHGYVQDQLYVVIGWGMNSSAIGGYYWTIADRFGYTMPVTLMGSRDGNHQPTPGEPRTFFIKAELNYDADNDGDGISATDGDYFFGVQSLTYSEAQLDALPYFQINDAYGPNPPIGVVVRYDGETGDTGHYQGSWYQITGVAWNHTYNYLEYFTINRAGNPQPQGLLGDLAGPTNQSNPRTQWFPVDIAPDTDGDFIRDDVDYFYENASYTVSKNDLDARSEDSVSTIQVGDIVKIIHRHLASQENGEYYVVTGTSTQSGKSTWTLEAGGNYTYPTTYVYQDERGGTYVKVVPSTATSDDLDGDTIVNEDDYFRYSPDHTVSEILLQTNYGADTVNPITVGSIVVVTSTTYITNAAHGEYLIYKGSGSGGHSFQKANGGYALIDTSSATIEYYRASGPSPAGTFPTFNLLEFLDNDYDYDGVDNTDEYFVRNAAWTVTQNDLDTLYTDDATKPYLSVGDLVHVKSNTRMYGSNKPAVGEYMIYKGRSTAWPYRHEFERGSGDIYGEQTDYINGYLPGSYNYSFMIQTNRDPLADDDADNVDNDMDYFYGISDLNYTQAELDSFSSGIKSTPIEVGDVVKYRNNYSSVYGYPYHSYWRVASITPWEDTGQYTYVLTGRDGTNNPQTLIGSLYGPGNYGSYSPPTRPRNIYQWETDFHWVDVQPKTYTFSDGLASSYAGTKELEMVYCEPGTFEMLTPYGLQYTTLTKGFYFSRYEVTQAQYEAVMTGNSDGLSATPSQWLSNPDSPVESVSWDDAQKFLTRLNLQQAGNLPAGWSYALPTEAQWEYACRAGTTTDFWWGDFLVDSSRARWNNNSGGPVEVGSYPPNPWGIYDTHGNVAEWCSDWYENIPSVRTVTDPTGPETGSKRVFRGGSYRDTQDWNLHSGLRRNEITYFGFEYIGLRLALVETDYFGYTKAELDAITAYVSGSNLPTIGTIIKGILPNSEPIIEGEYYRVTGEIPGVGWTCVDAFGSTTYSTGQPYEIYIGENGTTFVIPNPDHLP